MSWNSWQEIGYLFGTFLGIRTRFRIGRRYGYSRRNWRAKVRFWEELQRQLDEEGYSIKRGTIQDASIISSDPGHAPADKPRGDVAKTRRSRDGSRVRWEPNRNSDTKFIRSSIRNTRSSDDSIRQLHRFMTVRSISRRKERPSTAIKGISGLVPFASMDKTMRRSVRGHPISTKDKRRNSAISRVRSLVERLFDVIKRVFHSGHLMVTTHLRAQARLLFTCFSYNLFNLVSIRNRQIQR